LVPRAILFAREANDEAFPAQADFEAAKIAVFAASILSAVIGVTALSLAGEARPSKQRISVSGRAIIREDTA
jgi:hypothetical protein